MTRLSKLPETVVVAALDKCMSKFGVNTLQLLLNRDGGLGVTEPLLKATVEPEAMKELLQYSPMCRISPGTLEAAAMKPLIERGFI